jgi:hypothetical protein
MNGYGCGVGKETEPKCAISTASPPTKPPSLHLFRVINRYVGNLPPMLGVFPDYPAPVIRNTNAGTELAMMRWGMPPPPRTGGPPVTHIRNTSSPHWRGWLKPEKSRRVKWARPSRCQQNSIRNEARLLLFNNGRAAATANCAFIADSGLFDAVFSFHASFEGHRTDLRHDFLVRRTCGGDRALMARTLHDIVLIG